MRWKTLVSAVAFCTFVYGQILEQVSAGESQIRLALL